MEGGGGTMERVILSAWIIPYRFCHKTAKCSVTKIGLEKK